jgi:pSer/pThr/pTyr-binding forkhead associated (FHA) protein
MTHEHTNDCAECPQLHISEAGRAGRTIAVRGTTTIGRDNDNDIVLESMTVSRQHALLLRDMAGLRLLDLESTNGTLVNGVPASTDAPVCLKDGDVIRIGQALVRYAADGQAGPADRAPSPAPGVPAACGDIEGSRVSAYTLDGLTS